MVSAFDKGLMMNLSAGVNTLLLVLRKEDRQMRVFLIRQRLPYRLLVSGSRLVEWRSTIRL